MRGILKISPGAWIVVGLLLGLLLQSGVPYQTGHQWYEDCWRAQHANGKEASSPSEAATWAQCQPVAERALFDAGWVFSGNPEYAVTPQLKAVTAACPSNYSDIPIAGIHYLVVPEIEKAGGADLLDRFLPPDPMIVRAMSVRWPHCAQVRFEQGIPKIVKKDGKWDFVTECWPCKAEQQAKDGTYKPSSK